MAFARPRSSRSTRSLGTLLAFAIAIVVGAGACGSPDNPGAIGTGSTGNEAGGIPACSTPSTGCPCSTGDKIACGDVVTMDGDYVTCSMGERSCEDGTWSACLSTHMLFKSLHELHVQGDTRHLGLGKQTNCGGGGDAGVGSLDAGGNPCDPTCQTFNDNSSDASTDAALLPTDAGGWTLPPEPVEGGGCVGLQCQIPICPFGQTTSFKGKVFDPASQNPVFNAVVMIPNGPVLPIPAGVSNDPCGGAVLPAADSYAYSASDGTFTLTNVPVGTNIPLVIQIGRWRRQVTIDTSALKCSATTTMDISSAPYPSCAGVNNYAGTVGCLTRLPRVQSEGNIPHIAFASGGADAIECVLYDMGVSINEFTDELGTGRIHYFNDGGTWLASPNVNHDLSYLLGFNALYTGIDNPGFDNGSLTPGWTVVTGTHHPLFNNSVWNTTSPYSVELGQYAVNSACSTAVDTIQHNAMVAPPGATKLNVDMLELCGGVSSVGMTNPGFETGTLLGWTGAGAVSNTNARVHTGSRAALLGTSGVKTNTSTLVQTFNAPPVANHLYLYYWRTCTGTAGFGATLTDNTNPLLSPPPLATACVTDGAWQLWQPLVTGGHNFTLTLTNTDAAGTNDYTYVDDVAWWDGSSSTAVSLKDNTTSTTTTYTPVCEWDIAHTASLNVTAGHNYTVQLLNTNQATSVSCGGTFFDNLRWTISTAGAGAALTDNYDLVMLPCDGGGEYSSSRWGAGIDDPGRVDLVKYANKGGRVFTSHWGREWIERTGTGLPSGPFPGVATWIGDISPGNGNVNGNIVPGTTWGNNLESWMWATPGSGLTSPNSGPVVISPYLRQDTSAVSAASRLFLSYTAVPAGCTSGCTIMPYPADFTFDTPVGGTATGRVMYTDMHLAGGLGTTGTFPANCSSQGTKLTQQEDVAEYLLFDLGSCVSGLPLPTPVVNYYPATFTRDFQATCASGFRPVWRFFYWEDVTPGDSNIQFTAWTADTQLLLGTQYPSVNLPTASGADHCPLSGCNNPPNPPVPPACGPSCSSLPVAADVDPLLIAGGVPTYGQPAAASRSWLRVNMTLNPTSDKLTPPTLLGWQQTYDCVSAE